MAEFIYTMHNVRKAVGDKVILDNVTLSFFPGAKIGVVGPNGAGKSTMLKLMAGLDKPNNGDANLAKGATVGICFRSPRSPRTKLFARTSKRPSATLKPSWHGSRKSPPRWPTPTPTLTP